jgi:hypothetical protein
MFYLRVKSARRIFCLLWGKLVTNGDVFCVCARGRVSSSLGLDEEKWEEVVVVFC